VRVLVAGGGPVARALAAALEAAGVEVGRWTRGRPGSAAGGQAEVALVAVADAAIGGVARRLFEEGRLVDSAVVLHTAGALAPSLALAEVADRAGGRGLLHPLRAFARQGAAPDLRGTVFGVAGDEPGRAAALELCRAVGGRPLLLDEAAVPRYHAAAVLVGNHTLALVDAAIVLLEAEGLDRAAATAALLALLRSAVDNVESVGLPAALTGPIARGDEATVAGHLAALPDGARSLYRATGCATVELSRRQGRADAEALSRIATLLGCPRGVADPTAKR
jgi:predicted short-subunit dehydrogenase-like oxidoreductase (DUF2520 family)